MTGKEEEIGKGSLPNGWMRTTLGAVCQIIGGGTPSTKESDNFDGGNIPWITPADLTGYKNVYVSQGGRSLTEKGYAECGAKMLPKGTVLFSSRAPIGYVAITANPVCTNQGFRSFAPCSAVASEYLYYFLKSAKEVATSLASGTTFLELSGTAAATIPVPLAPLPEQSRIVEEIERLFSLLDAGVANLKRVQANLKRYRASVLQAACTGRLVPTEAELARTEGRYYEPADVLLQRILAERHAKWEADQLAKMRAAGKYPKDDKWKAKYEEPAVPDTHGLSDLPEGWTWISVEQSASSESASITDGPFGSNLKTEHYVPEGPRVIRLQNIGDGKFIDARSHITEEHFSSLKRHNVIEGDIVIAGLSERPPRACIIPPNVGPAIVKADCIRLRSNSALERRYIHLALNAEPTRKRTSEAVHGVGRPRLNLGEIKAIVLPLPPLAEQERIVAEVERRLSVVDALETTVAQNLKRAERLRQAILRDAFAGKLVPQDPSDEPASLLLARIEAERAEKMATEKPKVRTKK